jgi:hypothetical protein
MLKALTVLLLLDLQQAPCIELSTIVIIFSGIVWTTIG